MEIDINEMLTGQILGAQVLITPLILGALFDGPEPGDVNEITQITINGTRQYTLTATTFNVAARTGSGTVTNVLPANLNSGGARQITNPFGTMAITSMSFSALLGTCAGDMVDGACNNQPDFTLV